MLFAGRRLVAANLLLGAMLDDDPTAGDGWAATEERVRWGYVGWIAEALTTRGRRTRATITVERARAGPLEFQPAHGWHGVETPGT